MAEILLTITVAASCSDPRGEDVTPGLRLEEDADGRVWRTPIGMDGRPMGERYEVGRDALDAYDRHCTPSRCVCIARGECSGCEMAISSAEPS